MASVDDSIIAALQALSGQKDEHMGMIYQDGDSFRSTPTQSTAQRSRVGGTFKIPTGSLRALFHNHPVIKGKRDLKDRAGEDFSDDDKKQARALKVPSYILTPSGKLMKFDPIADEITEIKLPAQQEVIPTSGAHNVLVN
jgi:hypothetical protein